MILSCSQLEKSFGEQVIVKKGNFHIEANEKVALIGTNGAGKSTILKIIMGLEPLDSGSVIISKESTIGYLSQHQEMNSSHTILEEVTSVKQDLIDLEQRIRAQELRMKECSGEELENELAQYHKNTTSFEQQNGYAYKSEIVGVLKGLGFDEADFTKNINTLSGGQKTRVALSKLLLTKPNILLLDEPTNHLDMNSISWLETYLINYKGAVLIVSHDRYFLNRVVTKVVEVEHGELTMFSGNYTEFSQKKKILQEMKVKEYYKQQQEIKHQEEVIAKLKSFNREKSIKRAESREKTLAKIDRIEKPITEENTMHFSLTPNILSGNDVLSIESLSKSFDTLPLFDDINLEIKRGEHVAIIGDNGTGKTTLLKILNEVIPADHGTFKLGSNVHIGYYDQEHTVLNMDKTIFEEISDEYPDMKSTQIRNTLAAFLFTGDDVYKKIQSLSGGERGRVSLAKLMLSKANFLILDEPTNHLDISSKEILERVICEYSGTVLFVSHDRYFINQTATRILDLVNRTFVNYIGNYDYYLEKKDILTPSSKTEEDSTGNDTQDSDNKLDWKAQKELQSAQRKKETAFAKLEAEIMELENRDSEIDTLLSKEEIFTDVEKCCNLAQEKEVIAQKLVELYEKWEEYL